MAQVLRKMLPGMAAFGLLVGLSAMSSSPARAQDAKPEAKGSVSGPVTDKDGKALDGVEVRLMKPRQRGGGPGGGGPGGGGGAGGGGGGTPPPPPGQLQQRQGPPAIATATTDKDGKYEMKDVPVGNYMVGVFDPEKKQFGRARVTVEEGKTATADIKCSDQMPQRGRGGPGGGGGGGGGGGTPPPPQL
jgi:hypothetical protein